MTTVYVPYSRLAPQTDDLTVLRAELKRVREVYRRGSSQGMEAYQRLSRAAGQAGRPLDALNTRSPFESERFFARVVPGPDGHHYWTGGREFRGNTSRHIPRRWWWRREHGEDSLSQYDDLGPDCGDSACIAPDHQGRIPRAQRRMRYTDEQMLGALQVVAMRLGRTPGAREWDAAKHLPCKTLYNTRFGSWEKAVTAAGLNYETRVATLEKCIASLRLARDFLGRWPSSYEVETRTDLRDLLRKARLPISESAIRMHLGPWAEALRKAGAE